MNNNSNSTNLVHLVLSAGLALAVAGCASPGYQQGFKAAETIQVAANRIAQLCPTGLTGPSRP